MQKLLCTILVVLSQGLIAAADCETARGGKWNNSVLLQGAESCGIRSLSAFPSAAIPVAVESGSATSLASLDMATLEIGHRLPIDLLLEILKESLGESRHGSADAILNNRIVVRDGTYSVLWETTGALFVAAITADDPRPSGVVTLDTETRAFNGRIRRFHTEPQFHIFDVHLPMEKAEYAIYLHDREGNLTASYSSHFPFHANGERVWLVSNEELLEIGKDGTASSVRALPHIDVQERMRAPWQKELLVSGETACLIVLETSGDFIGSFRSYSASSPAVEIQAKRPPLPEMSYMLDARPVGHRLAEGKLFLRIESAAEPPVFGVAGGFESGVPLEITVSEPETRNGIFEIDLATGDLSATGLDAIGVFPLLVRSE